MPAAEMPCADTGRPYENAGVYPLTRKATMLAQPAKQHKQKKGLFVGCQGFSCFAAPQCTEPLSPPPAAPSTGCSCSWQPAPLHCPDSLQANRVDHGPFASAWQQQQRSDVLHALQPCGSVKLQPGASAQLSGILSEDWFDTQSMFSEASLLEQHLSDQLQAATHQAFSPTTSPLLELQLAVLWVPDTPLLFAEPGLRFVPVPAMTGFAGYWEVDHQRTTPHLQPIDVMVGASYLVRKVHKSIQGMGIAETAGQLTLAAQPRFLPPGLPSSYCEVYDEVNKAESSWAPRRDLRLGSCSWRVYMTDTSMMVLRVEFRPPFSRKVDFISEDYLTLDQGGSVIVDRMFCLDMASGRRAMQLQVARLRPDKS